MPKKSDRDAILPRRAGLPPRAVRSRLSQRDPAPATADRAQPPAQMMDENLCTTDNPGAPGTFEAAESPYQAADGPPGQLQVATTQITMKPLSEMTKRVNPKPWAEGEYTRRPASWSPFVPQHRSLLCHCLTWRCPPRLARRRHDFFRFLCGARSAAAQQAEKPAGHWPQDAGEDLHAEERRPAKQVFARDSTQLVRCELSRLASMRPHVGTDLAGDRMSVHAGTRAQEMTKPSSLVPSDGSLALTPRCPN